MLVGSPFGLMGGEAAGYQIANSLIFNDDDSAYLTWTPSASDRDLWTFSAWVKRSNIGTSQSIFSAYTDGTNQMYMGFLSGDTLYFQNSLSAALSNKESTAVYRDVGAWYHVVFIWDSANATAADRMRMYVNGDRITVFDTSNNPTSGVDSMVNSAIAHNIGQRNSDLYCDMYMAEIHFVDGSAEEPSSFGETDATTGQWIPKAYTGTYGTNGFYLDFEDGTSTTTLGYDVSGNDNHWTLNNMATTDQTTDTPTDNYATFNPLVVASDVGASANLETYQEGNLEVTLPTGSNNIAPISICPQTGKWGVKAIHTDAATNFEFGVGEYNNTLTATGVKYNSSGNISVDGSTTQTGLDDANTNGDEVEMLVDFDSLSVLFKVNGTTVGTSETMLQRDKFVIWVRDQGTATQIVTMDFGQKGYTPSDSSYKTICTANLPEPAIKKPSDYFNAVKYVGDGSADQGITGVGFQPDLVWIKNRDQTDSHKLVDSVRGATIELESDTTAAEATNADGLLTFDSDGFSVGADLEYNTNTENYISWNWLESATSGFDIVTYTGNDSNRTIAHNLGVTPDLIIVKSRTNNVSSGLWVVYHSANTAAPETDYLRLNATNGTTDAATVWNDTAPTSSVFSVGTSTALNSASDTYVAYLFAGVEGYSKFGSYTGNGSTDGSFIYTGFRPALIVVKRTDTTANWTMFDTARDTYNQGSTHLYPNGSSAEPAANNEFDILSNGFKLRSGDANTNASGGTYVYMAFAEAPFKNSTAR